MYCKIVTVRRTLRSETATSFSAVWGPPYTGGPGQTAPVAPPPIGGTADTYFSVFKLWFTLREAANAEAPEFPTLFLSRL